MKNLFLILAITFSGFSGFSQNVEKGQASRLWSAQDQELLITGLKRNQLDLINEIQGLSEEQWNFKEDSSRWSIAEIVEHLFAQNESYRIEMRTALNQPELPRFIGMAKGNDQVFIDYATDTLKADAGFLIPIERFCSIEKATYAYNRTQDALINIVAIK